MEKVVLRVHDHPLLPFGRFCYGRCAGCRRKGYFYGGYRCNELGCNTVFHKDCAEPKPEISHRTHPEHPLKLHICTPGDSTCSICGQYVSLGYSCSICKFNLDLGCATIPQPSTIQNYKVHEHPLEPSRKTRFSGYGDCRECIRTIKIGDDDLYYECRQCNLYIHSTCLEVLLPPYKHHSSHPKHPLKNLKHGSPSYADKKCLLCGIKFQDERFNKVRNKCYPHKNVLELYHCDVCNVCICMSCEGNPPPLAVVSLTTHEHEVHLIPRLLDFTCNACGTQGDRSPYFCLQCNFMIHRDCIDLPRIININRHDHRLSYTSHLGHGNQKCGVCRKAVDGCCGAYSCKKCPSYVVHSLCATRKDVWDMVELEGIPEEEEIAPFKVIDENTIKHMSHDHDLILYMDGRILHESKLCEACVCQINTDPFYSCEQCGFILHQTCAIMPREKRHVLCNTPFTLQANDSKDSPRQRKTCLLCNQNFTGFGYQSRNGKVMDVRCGSIFEPFVHKSHPHPLFYKFCNNKCDACETTTFSHMLCCDECEFSLDFRCATLPRKVVKQRHDDRPLYLSYIDNNVDGGYWCDICEKKVDTNIWFYTCDAFGVTLHVSCVVGDFSYQMPGPISTKEFSYKVVTNTSMCRPFCSRCLCRCKLSHILENGIGYYCSQYCYHLGHTWEYIATQVLENNLTLLQIPPHMYL